MKPYLSIIKDCFYEARATNIFWIVMAISTLFLLALCPFAYDNSKDMFTYMGSELFSSGGIGHKFVLTKAVEVIINYMIGVVAIIVAIVVTAGFIPNTFVQGSVDLLLSKPISRSGLFLTKFFGGCIFYLINIAYLLVGIFVILGVRFSIWEPKFLKCIAISLFLFVIYYSVSALAGLIWRNTVISIIITTLFWLLCFSVGVTKNIFETFVFKSISITEIVHHGDEVFAMKKGNVLLRWNKDKENWDDLNEADESQFFPGSIKTSSAYYDKASGKVYVYNKLTSTIKFSSEKNKWALSELETSHDQVLGLTATIDSKVLYITPNGLYSCKNGELFCAFNTAIKSSIAFPVFAKNKILLITENTLDLYTEKSGEYTFEKSINYDGGYDFVRGAFFKDHFLVLTMSGVSVYNDDLEKVYQENLLEADIASIETGPDKVYLLAGASRKVLSAGSDWNFKEADIEGQEEISAIKVNGDELILARNYINVYVYQNGVQEKSYPSELTRAQSIYKYAIVPLYYAFPKPGELDSLVAYLLSPDDKTVSKSKVWQPFWSSMFFVLVMLTLSSIYVTRKDY